MFGNVGWRGVTASESTVMPESATPEQLREMVKTLLNLETIPKPDDAADALAIALTSLQSSSWERLMIDDEA